MMKYEIRHSVDLEAGQIVKMQSEVVLDNGNIIPQNSLVKILNISKRTIFFKIICYSLKDVASVETVQHTSAYICNSSPAEEVAFGMFLQSINYVSLPELLEHNFDRAHLTKAQLLQYVAFLEDELGDKTSENKNAKEQKEQIENLIEWLDNLGDGQDDVLGNDAEYYIQILKKIIS
jgi:hypothetical protein